MSVAGKGDPNKSLSQEEIDEIVRAAAGGLHAEGRRVLAVVPDHTRTCPLPGIARRLKTALGTRVGQLDFLVALGTHPPMSDEAMDKLFGVPPGKRSEVFGDSKFLNHRWNDPGALTKIGRLSRSQIHEITGGKFAMDIDVTINKAIFEYDAVLIIGPVFPHEVAGLSGGVKYFFPGICGEELLNFFHWLGAVITNPRIIGNKHTPVRATLDAAFDMLSVETHALCMVVRPQGQDDSQGSDAPGLAGLYFGPVREAWSAAADLSAKVHIIYCDRPYDSVLSRAPEMYDDLWTGGKCMYKLEPVVADAGELIIYAPHITEISYTHGDVIREVGYHTRDYFLADWERFKKYPWGVLAHSTHVRGIGMMEGGIERPRIQVTLATGIPEELCRTINLGYRDPDSIDVSWWDGREDDGRLYVPKAGEMLYRLKDPPEWQRADE